MWWSNALAAFLDGMKTAFAVAKAVLVVALVIAIIAFFWWLDHVRFTL